MGGGAYPGRAGRGMRRKRGNRGRAIAGRMETEGGRKRDPWNGFRIPVPIVRRRDRLRGRVGGRALAVRVWLTPPSVNMLGELDLLGRIARGLAARIV